MLCKWMISGFAVLPQKLELDRRWLYSYSTIVLLIFFFGTCFFDNTIAVFPPKGGTRVPPPPLPNLVSFDVVTA